MIMFLNILGTKRLKSLCSMNLGSKILDMITLSKTLYSKILNTNLKNTYL